MYAVILSALCVASQGAPSELHFVASDSEAAFEKAWVLFKAENDKTYASVEEDHYRRKIFAKNLKEIESHNYLYDVGLTSFQSGVNWFTDMENSELEELNCVEMTDDNTTEVIDYLPLNDFVLPKSVDWRPKGYVTRVKDQKQCGSCWAFGATGSLEGQTFRKTGKLIPLSEQNLVDCSRPYGNFGCRGGYVSKAFNYIRRNGGIDTERSYPYTAKDGVCKYNRRDRGATVADVVRIRPGNEAILTQAVASTGPISVSITVSRAFMAYSKGIFEMNKCSPAIGWHAVLIVGYGSENGKDYWIVKNSWGAGWGENGYIRMARNKNTCRITSDPVYPRV